MTFFSLFFSRFTMRQGGCGKPSGLFRSNSGWAGILLLAAGLAGGACNNQTEASRMPPPRPKIAVTVARAGLKAVPFEVAAIGTVEPYQTVAVKTQVSGPLTAMHFKEGDLVQAGTVLYEIDPAPFQMAVEKAEAALQRSRANRLRNQALLENALAEVKRHEELVAKDYVTRQQYEAIQTTAGALQASIKADEAAIRVDEVALKNARLELGYCTIRAPISGRTGEILVYPGNIAKANDSVLLNLYQIQPVYVDFSVPEKELSRIRERLRHKRLETLASIPETDLPPEKGHLSFLDPNIAPGTGTIHLKAEFANPGLHLWPGQFVQVAVELALEPDRLVVPAAAVQTGQQGSFVFLVMPDRTVKLRMVQVVRAYGDELVLANGIQPGDTVVTDGHMRLVDGTAVEIKNQAPAGAEQRQ